MGRVLDRRTGPGQSTLTLYYRGLSQAPLLTAAEEKELARRVRQGDRAARDRLIQANLRLVTGIARRYLGLGLDLTDLIGEGTLGLLRAVEKFDPDRNCRFSTYATHWIRYTMRDALIRKSRLIRFPVHALQLLQNCQRTRAELRAELGREPTAEELRRRLRVSPRRLRLAQSLARLTPATPSTGQATWDGAPDQALVVDRLPSPVETAETAELIHQVRARLRELSEREATVLRMRFGLDGEPPMSLQQIGRRVGLTRERVRQIQESALDQLRDLLEAN